MIVLTGNYSIEQLFSIPKDMIETFEKISDEAKIRFYEIEINIKNNQSEIFIHFYNKTKSISNTDEYIAYLKDGKFVPDNDKLTRKALKLSNIIENSHKLDKFCESLMHKKYIIQDFLNQQNKLNIKNITTQQVRFQEEIIGLCDTRIGFCLNNKNSDFTYCLRIITKNNIGIYFYDCNVNDIKYILNNYETKERCKINLIESNKFARKYCSEYCTLREVKDEILKIIDDKNIEGIKL